MNPELQAAVAVAENAKAALVQSQEQVVAAQNAVVEAAQNYEVARQQLVAAVAASYPSAG